jgi:hypothetical protein
LYILIDTFYFSGRMKLGSHKCEVDPVMETGQGQR